MTWISILEIIWFWISRITFWGVFLYGLIIALEKLIRVIPTLKDTWINLIKWKAERSQFKSNKQYAIKADIENVINSMTAEISKELPKEWVRQAKIEWVNNSSNILLGDNFIIMRLRPLSNQDSNIINVTHSFFRSLLFPNTKNIIPNSLLEASALKITHRVIEEQKPFLSKKFEQENFEESLKQDKDIVHYFDIFDHLDRRGFFTSFAIPEIDEMASKIRLKEKRLTINEEIGFILKHVTNFSDEIYKIGETLKDEDWFKKGATSYAFLLVAKDSNMDANIYKQKAIKRRDAGIERLYVLGKSNRNHFTRSVINEISKLRGFVLINKFKLSYDYKGMKGGIGALFEMSK